MISALNRQPSGNLEITITIPWKQVGEAYQKTLVELTKEATIKGFRQGKAPNQKVEEQLGKTKIYEETLKDLIPTVYIEAVKEHQLKPIVNPQVAVISLEENKDWQIKATTCELPKVELGKYQDEVKKTLAAEKIWVPGKDKKEEDKQESEDKKMAKIFKTLIETCRAQIPEILLQEEVNRSLSRLIDQTGRLGLTVEQYLVSIGKTSEQIRQEYRQQAEETLKLELILVAIAEEQKVSVKEEDIDKMIAALPDEKAKETFKSPEQRAYLHQLLAKRQVIDGLAKL